MKMERVVEAIASLPATTQNDNGVDSMLLTLAQWLQTLRPSYGYFAGVPVPHFPRRDGCGDRLADWLGRRPMR
jgi:hypothetical protein